MKWVSFFLISAGLTVAAQYNLFAQSCDCEVSDCKEAAYDQLLFLSDAEIQDCEALHLPYGLPTSSPDVSNEILLHQQHFITYYDGDLRIPLWVAYRLSSDDFTNWVERKDCFRRDIRVTDDDMAAFCDDYDEPIFDRGHMAPSAAMRRNEAACVNTCVLTNITPQYENFNQMIWRYFEEYVRDWVRLKGDIYVITGAVLDKDGNNLRDDDSDASRVEPLNRVAIPTHFYKIILHERPNGFIESLAVLLPHDNEKLGQY